MIHKGRGIPFQCLIGESHNPDEQTGIHYSQRELSQLHPSQRQNGRANSWKVDALGIQTGYNNYSTVHSTK